MGSHNETNTAYDEIRAVECGQMVVIKVEPKLVPISYKFQTIGLTGGISQDGDRYVL
jgi:hypothetical protein